MRRRPYRREVNSPAPALALFVALALHAWAIPSLVRWFSHPAHRRPPVAERKEPTPESGMDQSVEARLLTPKEVEALIGPVPPAAAPAPPPEPPTEPPAPPTKPPEARPDRQIVSIPPPAREEVPKEARFLSEYESSAVKEQVSALNGVPTPEMRRGQTIVVSGGDDPDGNTTDPKLASKEKAPPLRPAMFKRPGDGEAERDPSRERGQRRPRQDAVLGKAEPPSDSIVDPNGAASQARDEQAERLAQEQIRSGGPGQAGGANLPPSDVRSLLPTIGPADLARQEGNVDEMPDDVERGRGTFLNTHAFKHAWFYNRLKEEIYEHWNVVGAYRRYDPYGRVFGVRDRVTVLRIELKNDGSLRDVYVLQNSGASFLDDVALQAVREAQPFPNPPGGLADDDGIIRITYRFTLDIETGGFRLF